MNGHDIERARAALQAIPPDLPREDWTRAGMAAKAAGLTLEDFTGWSANGGNYAGPKDCASVWASFKSDGIGPGTLFHLAFSHGWKDTARAQRQPSQASQRQAKPQRAQPDA
ncbi:MAG: PriCT-2 domain-containing protein, partial [Thiomonas sp.]|nr:PriCT-2 domain-containing protein [Thiomonas sp.]